MIAWYNRTTTTVGHYFALFFTIQRAMLVSRWSHWEWYRAFSSSSSTDWSSSFVSERENATHMRRNWSKSHEYEMNLRDHLALLFSKDLSTWWFYSGEDCRFTNRSQTIQTTRIISYYYSDRHCCIVIVDCEMAATATDSWWTSEKISQFGTTILQERCYM